MKGNLAKAIQKRRQSWYISCGTVVIVMATQLAAWGQSAADPGVLQRIQGLTDAINHVESQLQESQSELADLRQQLASLRGAAGAPDANAGSEFQNAEQLAEAVASLRESQSVNDSQIATLEQSKAETESKYPFKLSGMVLMTAFVNSNRVDNAAEPGSVLSGAGSTGATFENTVLGFDATGPHLFGAESRVDARFDLSGSANAPGSTNSYTLPLIRFRTAHGELIWAHSRIFASQDKTVMNPNSPTSIAAVALPPLAWSGNLWSWNPRFGASRDLVSTRYGAFKFQAALTDVADPPPLFVASQTSTYTSPSTSELSRWPGAEGRLAFESDDQTTGLKLGLSGFVAPHRATSTQTKFNSWAGAFDFTSPLGRFMQISGNFYRGAALGSLGGGAYKNFVLRNVVGPVDFKVLDDEGGWLQWKQKPGERIEFNEAFGVDNVPAHQLRPYAISTPISYYNLARNRSITGNVIYSPSAYLLFSLEYRRLASSYVTAPTAYSNIISIAAGYRF